MHLNIQIHMATIISFALSSSAWAHPGHGAPGVHWHSHDIALSVLLAVVAGAIVLLIRRK
jgi:hypothetical protein